MLRVKVLYASHLRNVQAILNQDPYVQIYLENQPTKSARTGTEWGAGRNPTWRKHNVLQLERVTEANDQQKSLHLVVEAWDDERVGKHRLLGRGMVDLSDYEEDGAEEIPMEVELRFDNKFAGTVSIQLSFEPGHGLQNHHSQQQNSSMPQSQQDATLLSTVYSYIEMVSNRIRELWNSFSNRLSPEQKRTLGAIVCGVAGLFFVSASFRWMICFLLNIVWWILTSSIWYILIPVAISASLPRLFGWGLTKIVHILAHGYPITFGTICIVPYMTDFKSLKFRLTVKDFFMGNPPIGGYTPRFLSLDMLDLEASCSFKHLWNCLTLKFEPCPLKKIPDYQRLITFDVHRLEFTGVTIDFQVCPKSNRLNINEMTKAFAVGEVHAALKQKGMDLDKFKFPNCLEVQVVRARNLMAMDANGFSDPYYVVKVRKEKRKGETIVKTLNPIWADGKIERFHVSDPASVVIVQIWDEDVGMQADFIGQWIMTTKWLLMDPKHCLYSQWLDVSEEEREEGWISMWVPLLDQNFRGKGSRGEVHIKLRWRFDPDLDDKSKQVIDFEQPSCFPPLTKCPKKPLDQITENRLETRARLGDLHAVMSMLNHIPVLFNFTGPVIVRKARISVKELLFGRKLESKSKKKSMRHPPSSATNVVSGDRQASSTSPREPGRQLGEVVESPSPDSKRRSFFSARLSLPALRRLVSRERDQQKKYEATSEGDVPPQSEIEKVSSTRSLPTTTSSPKLESSTKTLTGFSFSDLSPSDLITRGRATMAGLGLMNGGTATPNSKEDGLLKRYESTDELTYTAVPPPTNASDDSQAPAISFYQNPANQEDEADNDETDEVEQDGRKFVIVKLIEWHTQFKARHGDEGITMFKVFDRFFRGLAPKLAANQKLHFSFAGLTLKSLIFDADLMRTGDKVVSATLHAASKMIGGVVSVAKVAQHQKKFMEQKYFSNSFKFSGEGGPAVASNGGSTGKSRAVSVDETGNLFSQFEDGITSPSKDMKISPMRRLMAMDEDFMRPKPEMTGFVERLWQGRTRNAFSLFGGERWKLLKMEIKGEMIFFKKIAQYATNWYVLDLEQCCGIVLAKEHQPHPVLRLSFGEGGSIVLQLRLAPSNPTPTLKDWLTAFERLRQIQQQNLPIRSSSSLTNLRERFHEEEEEEEEETAGENGVVFADERDSASNGGMFSSRYWRIKRQASEETDDDGDALDMLDPTRSKNGDKVGQKTIRKASSSNISSRPSSEPSAVLVVVENHPSTTSTPVVTGATTATGVLQPAAKASA